MQSSYHLRTAHEFKEAEASAILVRVLAYLQTLSSVFPKTATHRNAAATITIDRLHHEYDAEISWAPEAFGLQDVCTLREQLRQAGLIRTTKEAQSIALFGWIENGFRCNTEIRFDDYRGVRRLTVYMCQAPVRGRVARNAPLRVAF